MVTIKSTIPHEHWATGPLGKMFRGEKNPTMTKVLKSLALHNLLQAQMSSFFFLFFKWTILFIFWKYQFWKNQRPWTNGRLIKFFKAFDQSIVNSGDYMLFRYWKTHTNPPSISKTTRWERLNYRNDWHLFQKGAILYLLHLTFVHSK